MMFGGRVAEELIFGQMTTGAGDDIEKATELARKMVCEWGMSKELGPMTFGKREEQVFLGRDIAHQKDYSEHTAIEIDREVRRMIDEAYQQARNLLSDHLSLLHAVAERLLEKEVLDGAEVADDRQGLSRGASAARVGPAQRGCVPRVRIRKPARTSVPKKSPPFRGCRPSPCSV